MRLSLLLFLFLFGCLFAIQETTVPDSLIDFLRMSCLFSYPSHLLFFSSFSIHLLPYLLSPFLQPLVLSGCLLLLNLLLS